MTTHTIIEANSIHELLEAQISLNPDEPALKFDQVGMTFQQLNVRSNRLAHRLIREGVQTGSYVGLMAGHSPDTIVGIIGILKTGAAFVLLNPEDPHCRNQWIMSNAALSVVVTESRFLPELSEGQYVRLCLDDEDLATESSDSVAIHVGKADPAYMTYVSGPTGPEGKLIEHGAVLNFVHKLNESIYDQCKEAPIAVGLSSSMSSAGAMAQIVQILSGRCLHIIPDFVRREGGQELASYLANNEINILDTTQADVALLLAGGLVEKMPSPGIYLYDYWIDFTEIEAVLVAIPEIIDASVGVRKDDSGVLRLVAYIESELAVDVEQRIYIVLREQLPQYMMPSAIMQVSSILRLPDGRPDLTSLAAPDNWTYFYRDGFAAPRNAVEQVVSQMCAQALEITTVGIHDNFFQLGGHSIMATQFVASLQDLFPTDESLLSIFFQNPTVAALSYAILACTGDTDPQKIAEVIMQVMEMSEDETDALLNSQHLA